MRNQEVYELRCIVTHLGPSGTAGHYIAFCYVENENKWYKFDDSIVTESSFKDASNTGDSYLLFYKRTNNQMNNQINNKINNQTNFQMDPKNDNQIKILINQFVMMNNQMMMNNQNNQMMMGNQNNQIMNNDTPIMNNQNNQMMMSNQNNQIMVIKDIVELQIFQQVI